MNEALKQRLRVCLASGEKRCPHRTLDDGQRVVCGMSGKTVNDHAETAYCPAGRYPVVGLGDVVARVAYAAGVSHALAAARKRLGWECGCQRRHGRLNKWSAAVAKFVGRGRR